MSIVFTAWPAARSQAAADASPKGCLPSSYVETRTTLMKPASLIMDGSRRLPLTYEKAILIPLRRCYAEKHACDVRSSIPGRLLRPKQIPGYVGGPGPG